MYVYTGDNNTLYVIKIFKYFSVQLQTGVIVIVVIVHVICSVLENPNYIHTNRSSDKSVNIICQNQK